MNPRLQQITQHYKNLKIGILGDLCLDRYFEIDPTLEETSLETGLPVYNVVRVRSQPGAAGTILLNLQALGVAEIYPISFYGLDGEGFELERALKQLPAVRFDGLIRTDRRRTFTYGKPLIIRPNEPPRELNRLDIKNWDPTPPELRQELVDRLRILWPRLDAMIVLEQTDRPETGVICPEVLRVLDELAHSEPAKPVLADSRRGLADWPPLGYKMNLTELGKLVGKSVTDLSDAARYALTLSNQTRRHVFVTLAEKGILGCAGGEPVYHMPALPVRGPIDIVGAGDAVSANLIAALAAGASIAEALLLAGLAANIVIHQVGTTGTATVDQILELHQQYPEFVPTALQA